MPLPLYRSLEIFFVLYQEHPWKHQLFLKRLSILNISSWKYFHVTMIHNIYLTTTIACICTYIAKFMGLSWGQPGSCRPQVGLMLAPWNLLSGYCQLCYRCIHILCRHTILVVKVSEYTFWKQIGKWWFRRTLLKQASGHPKSTL